MAQLPARLFVLPILVATFFSGWPGLASAQVPSASGCWASPPPPPRVGYIPAGGQPRSSTDLSYLEWLRFFGPPNVRKQFPPEIPGQLYKVGERYVGNNGPYPYWLNNVPVLARPVTINTARGDLAGGGGFGFQLPGVLADVSPQRVLPFYPNYPTMFLPK